MTSSTPEALRSVASRLEMERLVARPVVARLRTAIRDAWDSALPESWRTLGFVQELTASAASVLEQDPEHSRALAQFAIAVATAVPRESYPPVAIAYVEGQAWKELGTAHRYLSAYDASLRAFDAARRAFSVHGALVHEHAIVDLATAVTLCDAARFEEALAMIARTTPIFAEYGDQRRLVHAAILRAMVYHRRGDYQHARFAYEEALQRAKTHGDTHTLASIYNNHGQACIELGDVDSAAASLTKARELFLQLAMLGEVGRTDAAIARLAMRKGNYRTAIDGLQRSRERLLEMNLIEEAGVVALDLIEALVAIDRRVEALQLTETIVDEFRQAGLDHRAIVALGYLRDLLPKRPQVGLPIDHVRKYLSEMRSDPRCMFVPLPE